jgi:hypothetical protein
VIPLRRVLGRRGYPLVADVGGPGGTGTGGSRRPRCAGAAAGRPRPRPRGSGSAPRSGSRRNGAAGPPAAAAAATPLGGRRRCGRQPVRRGPRPPGCPVPRARRGSRRAPAPRSSRAAGARSGTAPLLGRDGEAEVPAGVDVVALGHVERLAADRTPIRRSPISSRADHGWHGDSPLSREGSRAGATPSSRRTLTPQIVSLSDNLENPCHGSVARSVDCSSFLWLRSIRRLSDGLTIGAAIATVRQDGTAR